MCEGKKHRTALLREEVDHGVEQLAALDRVQPHRRVVEHEDLRARTDRRDEGELGALTAGEADHALLLGQAAVGDHLASALDVEVRAGVALEVEDAHRGHAHVHAMTLGEVADAPAILRAQRVGGSAEDLGAARMRGEEAHQDADRRRLAGTVSAEQRVDLPGLDLEAQTVQDDLAIEATRDAVESDDRFTHDFFLPRGKRSSLMAPSTARLISSGLKPRW